MTSVVLIFASLLVYWTATADMLELVLEPGDTGRLSCSGRLTILSRLADSIEAECQGRLAPTPTPTSSPPTSSGELLDNWQLYNMVDDQGNMSCSRILTESAPVWSSRYFSFRGPWQEDPDPDQCVARTQGEAYPDSSNQMNHVPVGETGSLWQVVQAPSGYSTIELSSIYAQHESGSITWSLWSCPNIDADAEDCSLIYRTDPSMRIPFLDTKTCSAYEMTLEVDADGAVRWNAQKVIESCPGEPIDQIVDTTSSFSPATYIGVLHEVTPLSGEGMSGVKIGNIKLEVWW